MRSACEKFLAALFAEYPAGTYVELRLRTASGMARAFYGVDRLDDVAAAINRHAEQTDVYVGVLARRRQASGHKDVVQHAHVVWVDCDTAESVAALADFSPEPAIIVASGSGANCHAYWLLNEPVSIRAIEMANRRLAHRLGGDEVCTDAARILRPPSLNHKHDPPQPVRLLRCETSHKHRLDELGSAVDDVATAGRNGRARESTRNADDPLLAIEPSRYIEELAGIAVPRHRKVPCPFHDDGTPSLHVYDDPQRGWYCFGCGRGGSIYDFAALLWLTGQSSGGRSGWKLRGREFLWVHERLVEIFLSKRGQDELTSVHGATDSALTRPLSR